MPTCEVCKVTMKQITHTHLKKHGMSISDYQSIYPDSPLISEELRSQYGWCTPENNSMMGKEAKDKVSMALKGVPKSEEHKSKISLARAGKSWGHHTEEHKKRMSVVSKAIMIEKVANGWKPTSTPEGNAARSKKMIGNTNGKNGHHNKGKTLDLTDDQRLNRSRKRSDWLSRNENKSTNTSIELIVQEYLTNIGMDFVSQFIIEGKRNAWIFDFFIPSKNLLIEVDGEYWHSTKKAINRDKLKSKEAASQGFTLLRISDSDMNMSIIHESVENIEKWTNDIVNRRINKLQEFNSI